MRASRRFVYKRYFPVIGIQINHRIFNDLSVLQIGVTID
jgi:hypothetical protein